MNKTFSIASNYFFNHRNSPKHTLRKKEKEGRGERKRENVNVRKQMSYWNKISKSLDISYLYLKSIRRQSNRPETFRVPLF